ncbi:hypothetical protein E4V01_00470 [Methylorubrum sp. Q1]|uniref:hypothetical protein n=1 Tax=Methylorubrum sp. Q1 TaxID=2562453 RepID=UPI001076A3B1|nr:hypothetical protein [Methylorubrum sp. Q1]TFZ61122.1 hypothetical protein E4V01_00470 [Methylorubrum sp. Q1]
MNEKSPYERIAELPSEQAFRGRFVIERLLSGDSLLEAAEAVGISPDLSAIFASHAASAVVDALQPFVDPDAAKPQPMPRRSRPASWPHGL